MRNVCMAISYDGTGYNGFQSQTEHRLNTVQDRIEEAIKALTGETIKIIASGRTDAGVHARMQVFNFTTSADIPVDRWCMALNARLPDDIRAWKAAEVSADFHSRRSAKQKTYRYSIRCGRHPNLFARHMEFHHYTALDAERMREGLVHLVGEHDFTSFCSTRSTKPSHIRTIYNARIECEPYDPMLQSYVMHIFLTGNGFLYNMVRIIAGTLIEVGMGKKESEAMKHILEAKNRALAGPTAMAHGLMLWEVFYDEFHSNS